MVLDMRVLTLRFIDNAEFEQKHKRDKNGQFSSSAGGGTQPKDVKQTKNDERTNKPLTTSVIAQAVQAGRLAIQNGREPVGVIRATAISLRGVVRCTLPESGDVDVVIGGAYRKEAGRHLDLAAKHGESAERLREIAFIQLESMSHIDDLLKNGNRTEWTHDAKHHPNEDFMTIYKRYPYKGKNRVFCVDVKRPTETKANNVKAHLSNGSGIPGFVEKGKKLGRNFKDGVTTIEVVRSRWV